MANGLMAAVSFCLLTEQVTFFHIMQVAVSKEVQTAIQPLFLSSVDSQ